MTTLILIRKSFPYTRTHTHYHTHTRIHAYTHTHIDAHECVHCTKTHSRTLLLSTYMRWTSSGRNEAIFLSVRNNLSCVLKMARSIVLSSFISARNRVCLLDPTELLPRERERLESRVALSALIISSCALQRAMIISVNVSPSTDNH